MATNGSVPLPSGQHRGLGDFHFPGSKGKQVLANPTNGLYNHSPTGSPHKQPNRAGAAYDEFNISDYAEESTPLRSNGASKHSFAGSPVKQPEEADPPTPDYFKDSNTRQQPNSLHTSPDKGKKVDRTTDAEPHSNYLPGCSGGQPKEKQVVSNSMMQAYVKMRGPCMGGNDDPLFEWIRLRDELPAQKPRGHKKDVSRMLELIDQSLDPFNMGGDSPRDAIFEVERPVVQHIEPPADMDLSMHTLTACCADFEWESDEDDEEGDIPRGRVSPCTFLAWSKNCTRWDDKDIKPPCDSTVRPQRHRPPTPEVPATPKDHFPHYYNHAQAQYDEVSGESLSPYYEVPTSPSVIYTPPGIASLSMPNAQFQASYNRMVPLVARNVRKEIYKGTAPNKKPTDENETYSHSEVEQAASQMKHTGPTGPLDNQGLKSYLGTQWLATRANERAEAALHAETAAQKAHLQQLQEEHRKLRYYVPYLQHQRAQRALYEAERARRERRERIQEHVVEHTRDVQHALDRAWTRLSAQHVRRRCNDDAIARLEREVAALCRAVGKREPAAVYDEVLGFGTLTVQDLRDIDREVRELVAEDGAGGFAGRKVEVPGAFRSWGTDL